ncbi:hypothetical protein ACFLUC_03075 [Chloroflexota bacterium]
MINHFSDWLNKVSNGWLVLLSLLVFILFTTLILPGQAADAEVSSAGAGSPDLSFYYTPQTLYNMAEVYGEAGRTAYIKARFTFDLIWPLVYTFFLTISLSWLCAIAFPSNSLGQRLNLVPVLAMIFDYLENISGSLVMARYPHQTPVLDTLMPVFTMLKWILVSSSIILLVIGGITVLLHWITQSR